MSFGSNPFGFGSDPLHDAKRDLERAADTVDAAEVGVGSFLQQNHAPVQSPLKTPEEYHLAAMAREKQVREAEAVAAAMKAMGLIWDAERTLLFGLTISDNKLVGLKSGLWLGGVFGFFVGVLSAFLMVKFGGVKL